MNGPAVVLVGPPGSGKSVVGALLGARLGVPARDTDDDVARAAGKPVAEIFLTDGEQAFRALEVEVALSALAAHDGVLALGGGAVLDPRTQSALEAYAGAGGCVVFLDVSLAHAGPRVGLNQPRAVALGNPRAQWQALMDARRPVYERLASVTVSTDDRTPEDVAAAIDAAMEGAA